MTSKAPPHAVPVADGDRLPVLYISYDGMLEPLGQSQVLGYLEILARDGPVFLISYEKPRDRADTGRMNAMRYRLSTAGIRW